jgi:hypothetical protein
MKNVRIRFFVFGLFVFLACAFPAWPQQQSQAPEQGTVATPNPWTFDTSLYMWSPSLKATMRSGMYRSSIDMNLIDMWQNTKSIPIVAMGRFEAHYKRFGAYVDDNYFNMNFKDQMVNGINTGLLLQMNLLEYAATYQVAGEPGRDYAKWGQVAMAPSFFVYGGARTIWMKTEIQPSGLPGSSQTNTLTSPLVGGRAIFGISPKWYFVIDGNAGGFNVMDVNFAGQAFGVVNYATKVFDIPTSLILGYKVLYIDVSTGSGTKRVDVSQTMYGPVIGATFSW